MSRRIEGGLSTQLNPFGPQWPTTKAGETPPIGQQVQQTLFGKAKPAVLAFALHAEVPFTNNQAERDLRPVKVKQKIAGCFRTLGGAHHYARIQSFIATARKQQRHVFKELRQIFLGDSFLIQPVSAK